MAFLERYATVFLWLVLLVPIAVAQGSSEPVDVVLVDNPVVVDLPGHRWKAYGDLGGVGLNCALRGWKQKFLYSGMLGLPGAAGLSSAAEFHVDLPASGCYLIEEFHPERCNQSLSPAVSVQIEHLEGESSINVDQTVGGNRWNPIALLPYSADNLHGKVSVMPSDVSSGLAIADAFRFTWVSATCPSAKTKLEQYSQLASALPSTIADDRTANKTGMAKSADSCSSTAMLGSAHVIDEGAGSVEHAFMPPSTGCYRVDEFHPSSIGTCQLNTKSKLKVDWCLGYSSTVEVDLAENGGQWNTVGHYMFYAGSAGKINASRPLNASQGALWAADAFRWTKVGACCTQVPSIAHATLHIKGVELEGPELSRNTASHSALRVSLLATISQNLGFSAEAVALNVRRGSVIVELQLSGHTDDTRAALATLRTALASPLSASPRFAPLIASFCEAVGATTSSVCTVELSHAAMKPSPSGFEPKKKLEKDGASARRTTIALIVGGLVVFLCASFFAKVAVMRFATPRPVKQVSCIDSVPVHVEAPSAEKCWQDNLSESSSTVLPSEADSHDIENLSTVSVCSPSPPSVCSVPSQASRSSMPADRKLIVPGAMVEDHEV
jgi:hypothetical protein